ncbi:MAG: methyltransferase domain-containing protein [Planctomycetota bacterium]|nr:methyltransferase domain-containing protein [Planctomycetota bacterium]
MPQLPVYFDRLIDAWENGRSGRCAHLGHWDFSPEPNESDSQSDGFRIAQQRLDDVMIEMAMVRSGQSVLDIGCGFGGLIECIDWQFTDMNLTGINIDPRQLDICHRLRSKSQNSIRWQEADACDLPFADNSFDCVFCVEAMFHFASRRTFLAEVLRVLKPAGRFAASDIRLTDSPVTATTPRFMIMALLNDGYGPWPDPWTDNGYAESICRELGFTGIKMLDATQNTLPIYDYIVPKQNTEQHDPGDPAARSAMLLRWLHRHGGLRYEYLSGVKA